MSFFSPPIVIIFSEHVLSLTVEKPPAPTALQCGNTHTLTIHSLGCCCCFCSAFINPSVARKRPIKTKVPRPSPAVTPWLGIEDPTPSPVLPDFTCEFMANLSTVASVHLYLDRQPSLFALAHSAGAGLFGQRAARLFPSASVTLACGEEEKT